MVVLGAFLAGFWLGSRAGSDSVDALMESANKIMRSEEFRSTLAGATSMARGAISQAFEPARESGSGLRVA